MLVINKKVEKYSTTSYKKKTNCSYNASCERNIIETFHTTNTVTLQHKLENTRTRRNVFKYR